MNYCYYLQSYFLKLLFIQLKRNTVMKKFALSVAAIATLIIPSVFAQACDWSGMYTGGSLGFASHSATFKDLDDYFDNEGMNADRKLSLAGALHVGWNAQRDSFVSGAELSYNLYNSSSASRDLYYVGNLLSARLRNAFSLKGRWGLTSGQNLVYVAAGPTLGDFKFKVREVNYINNEARTENILGLSAAVGFERQIDEHISFRIQAEDTEFKTSKLFNTHDISDSGAIARFAHTDSLLNVNLALSYKF